MVKSQISVSSVQENTSSISDMHYELIQWPNIEAQGDQSSLLYVHKIHRGNLFLLSDFINLTQVHNFTVSAQDIFSFRRLSVFTESFTGILQLLMQIMKRFVPSY